MAGRACALGCFAKTGRAMVVAVAKAPELVGKWDVTLVPDGQERFVYHAAELLGTGAARFVRDSTRAIGKETKRAVAGVLEELAGLDAMVFGAAIVGTNLEMPAPLEKILTSHTLLHTAEGVLYRSAIADALHARGIDCTLVPADALTALQPALEQFGKVPSPWRKEHKDAALAALTLVRAGGRDPAPRTGRAARPRRSA